MLPPPLKKFGQIFFINIVFLVNNRKVCQAKGAGVDLGPTKKKFWPTFFFNFLFQFYFGIMKFS